MFQSLARERHSLSFFPSFLSPFFPFCDFSPLKVTMTGRIPVDFQRWILDHPALNLGITSMDTIKQQQEQECPLPPRKRGRKSPVLWNPNRPTTHVSCLYPELLSMIFQYLDVAEKGRVAQVCTSWREAAYLRSVWRGVQAKLHLKKSSNSDVFKSLVRRGITKIQVSLEMP